MKKSQNLLIKKQYFVRIKKTTKEGERKNDKCNWWKPCGCTHTHTHTIMSTKEDVNSTSLLNMFEKARTQYKSGCDP